MLKLVCFPNLADRTSGVESEPWFFEPDKTALSELKVIDKDVRRVKLCQKDFQWNVFSGLRGMVSTARIGKDNQVIAIRAFVADYDLEVTAEAVEQYVMQLPEHLRPTYAMRSIGDKWQLVWVFEKELPIPSTDLAEKYLVLFAKHIKADRIMGGFDDNSLKPTQLWTNGADWFQTSDKPFDFEIVFGIAIKLIETQDYSSMEVPMEIIAKEVEKRFPNRWKGEFVEGAHGVRFWDAKADNPRGAFVCKTGCYCLTGSQPFMTWAQIFDYQWVDDQRILNIGKAASDYYFDGRQYWCQLYPNYWVSKNREDTLLHLASRGMTRKAGKGLMSDAEKVLLQIQLINRVRGCLPLVFRPAGPLILNGEKILNTSSIRPVDPISRPCELQEAPFLHGLLTNMWACPELHPFDHIISWLKIIYEAGLNQRPTPGQALFICGPKSNGKTLLCNRIVAGLLGGKIANPYDYLMKTTRFNSEIFAAIILAINDEEAPRGDFDRDSFQQGMKSFVVNGRHMYHAKFCDKVEVEWLGRLIVTLNDDAKSVGMLPERNFNTDDKMMFFRTVAYKFGWKSRHEIEEAVTRELPILGSYLLKYIIPDYVLDYGSRSQIKSYFDPTLIELSKQQEPSYNMWELLKTWQIQGAYWQSTPVPEKWEGTPTDLLAHLSENPSSNSLLKDWNVSKVAKALTSLARSESYGVEFIGQKENRIFRIIKTK